MKWGKFRVVALAEIRGPSHDSTAALLELWLALLPCAVEEWFAFLHALIEETDEHFGYSENWAAWIGRVP